MGRLTYARTVTVDFEDRVLAHLQLVIGAKLRRGESFHFSWREEAAAGSGRTTLWLHPHVSLVFRFWAGKAPEINRGWVDALMTAANSNAGLSVLAEPASPAGRRA